ncbi:MAG: hypothetical protein KGO96_13930 [Elusimicrobia bacterium]|nr:hypothetical protein [Elusimicrobiota bacterium]MDE2426993.1 hypothetical protein [Elusimicrobiota bacterium]
MGGWNVQTRWFLDLGPVEGVYQIDGDPAHDDTLGQMRDWLMTGGAPVAVTVTVGTDGKPVIGP